MNIFDNIPSSFNERKLFILQSILIVEIVFLNRLLSNREIQENKVGQENLPFAAPVPGTVYRVLVES